MIEQAPFPFAAGILALLALAILGVLGLGFYERRKMFALLTDTMQRNSTIAHALARVSLAGPPSPALAPPPASDPAPEPAGGGDLENDEEWERWKKSCEAEARRESERETAFAKMLQDSLLERQRQHAATLAAKGQLEPEPSETSAPTAAGP